MPLPARTPDGQLFQTPQRTMGFCKILLTPLRCVSRVFVKAGKILELLYNGTIVQDRLLYERAAIALQKTNDIFRR